MSFRALALCAVTTSWAATASAAAPPGSATPPPPAAPSAPAPSDDPEAKGPSTPRPGARPGAGGGTTTPPAPGTATPPPPGGAAPNQPPPEPEGPPVDLSETWGYSKSRPTQPLYVRSAEETSRTAPNPVGFYSGVSTHGNHVPPLPPGDFDTRPATMTWTGFERAPEGSRVFFELNGPAKHSMSQDGRVIKLRMTNTKVDVRNNQRFLDLRYFETPVQRVEIRRRGKDTEATIELKREATPTLQMLDGKGGYKLLTLQFDDARGSGGAGGTDPYRTSGGGGYLGGDPGTPPPPPPPGSDPGSTVAVDPNATDAGLEGQGEGAAAGPVRNPDGSLSYPGLDLFIVNYD